MKLTKKLVGGVIALLCLTCLYEPVVADTFDEDFAVTWGFDHVVTSADGQAMQLLLDNSSGSSFASKKLYLFGSVSMQIKLVPGDSAGVVTAYYLSSQMPSNRDELDFEFLGNTSGQPYILQTNVYTHGTGNREQRIYLWFDPTYDFHTYSFIWNQQQAVFFVDDIPIRVFLNNEKFGVPYANSQPMGLFSSIWNADQWATEGGLIKTNWSHAPFISSYQNFNLDACEWDGAPPACASADATNWWNQAAARSLDSKQLQNLKWVKQNYMVYDYCKDTQRFATIPTECSLNP